MTYRRSVSLLKAPSICPHGGQSLHLESVFNAPASAAAANGWYMLYNHRGRENPHSSAAVPSTENTDRKHSNHFKLRDLPGLPGATEQSQEEPVTPRRSAGLWSVTGTTAVPADLTRLSERRSWEGGGGWGGTFLQVPSGVCFHVRTCLNLYPSIYSERAPCQMWSIQLFVSNTVPSDVHSPAVCWPEDTTQEQPWYTAPCQVEPPPPRWICPSRVQHSGLTASTWWTTSGREISVHLSLLIPTGRQRCVRVT